MSVTKNRILNLKCNQSHYKFMIVITISDMFFINCNIGAIKSSSLCAGAMKNFSCSATLRLASEVKKRLKILIFTSVVI